jgi:hypothetical protein
MVPVWELILYSGATIFSPPIFAILGKSATTKKPGSREISMATSIRIHTEV